MRAVVPLSCAAVKTQWPTLALWGPASVLLRPQLMASFVHRLGRPAEESVDDPLVSFELRPLVVHPAARGTGLASRLTERLMHDARSRGFERMHLFVEIDNQVAQAFYRKMRFAVTGNTQHDGNLMVRYERSLVDAG